MKDKKKLKKRIIIVFVSLLAVLILALLVVEFVIPAFTPKVSFTEKQDDIFYWPEDYKADIFDRELYTSKDRDLRFMYYGYGTLINEENYDDATAQGQFFYDYFQTVIKGDYKAYPTYFAEEFYKTCAIPEKFTMQMIYDIEIELLDSDVKNGVVYETYKAGYKIMENNGTFRADNGSDECVPIAITLVKGTEYKISSIIPIY